MAGKKPGAAVHLAVSRRPAAGMETSGPSSPQWWGGVASLWYHIVEVAQLTPVVDLWPLTLPLPSHLTTSSPTEIGEKPTEH